MSRLRGKVVSGLGNFSQWIERLSSFYEHKTGMRLYPGTLNLDLPSDYSLPAEGIRLEADEYGARFRSTSFKDGDWVEIELPE
jgi:CTP-dependent riboflavin kinase